MLDSGIGQIHPIDGSDDSADRAKAHVSALRTRLGVWSTADRDSSMERL